MPHFRPARNSVAVISFQRIWKLAECIRRNFAEVKSTRSYRFAAWVRDQNYRVDIDEVVTGGLITKPLTVAPTSI